MDSSQKIQRSPPAAMCGQAKALLPFLRDETSEHTYDQMVRIPTFALSPGRNAIVDEPHQRIDDTANWLLRVVEKAEAAAAAAFGRYQSTSTPLKQSSGFQLQSVPRSTPYGRACSSPGSNTNATTERVNVPLIECPSSSATLYYSPAPGVYCLSA
jgi:hypothetical protein